MSVVLTISLVVGVSHPAARWRRRMPAALRDTVDARRATSLQASSPADSAALEIWQSIEAIRERMTEEGDLALALERLADPNVETKTQKEVERELLRVKGMNVHSVEWDRSTASGQATTA